jgi:putative inorganic carbon (HCO3(-)) transporter
MPLRPTALDYEGVFPSRARPGQDREAQVEWPVSGAIVSESIPVEANATNNSSAVAKPSNEEDPLTKREYSNQRGHSITFIGLFIFSVILYFRPYEMIPALSSFKSMAFYSGITTLVIFVITQVMLEGNLTALPIEVKMVLILGLAALLSIPLAINPAEAWMTFNENLLKALLIFIVIANVVRTEGRLKLLMLLALAVSIYLSINAINDYRLGIFRFGSLELKTARIGGSIRGLFDNSNDLALHLVTMVPIAFTLGLANRNVVKKALFYGTTGLMIGGVVVTSSRGAFLALIAVALLLLHKLGRRNKTVAAGTVVLGVVLFLIMAPATYSGRLATIFSSGGEASASQRTEILKRSVIVALRYPIFGVGVGNFHHRSIRELESHNAYTQVATEMGIGAMVIYMMFIIHPLRKLRRIELALFESQRHRHLYYLAIGIQTSLLAYMVASFFASVAYQWYVYYLVGYALALRRLHYQLEPEKSSPEMGQLKVAAGRQQLGAA